MPEITFTSVGGIQHGAVADALYQLDADKKKVVRLYLVEHPHHARERGERPEVYGYLAIGRTCLERRWVWRVCGEDDKPSSKGSYAITSSYEDDQSLTMVAARLLFFLWDEADRLMSSKRIAHRPLVAIAMTDMANPPKNDQPFPLVPPFTAVYNDTNLLRSQR